MKVTDELLAKMQEDYSKKTGMKVDVYHIESAKVIGVFPHNQMPTPFNSIAIHRY